MKLRVSDLKKKKKFGDNCAFRAKKKKREKRTPNNFCRLKERELKKDVSAFDAGRGKIWRSCT